MIAYFIINKQTQTQTYKHVHQQGLMCCLNFNPLVLFSVCLEDWKICQKSAQGFLFFFFTFVSHQGAIHVELWVKAEYWEKISRG